MKVFANIYESNGYFTPNLWLNEENNSREIKWTENNFHAGVLSMARYTLDAASVPRGPRAWGPWALWGPTRAEGLAQKFARAIPTPNICLGLWQWSIS